MDIFANDALFYILCSELDSKDFYSLSLTCKALYEICQRDIYCSIYGSRIAKKYFLNTSGLHAASDLFRQCLKDMPVVRHCLSVLSNCKSRLDAVPVILQLQEMGLSALASFDIIKDDARSLTDFAWIECLASVLTSMEGWKRLKRAGSLQYLQSYEDIISYSLIFQRYSNEMFQLQSRDFEKQLTAKSRRHKLIQLAKYVIEMTRKDPIFRHFVNEEAASMLLFKQWAETLGYECTIVHEGLGRISTEYGLSFGYLTPKLLEIAGASRFYQRSGLKNFFGVSTKEILSSQSSGCYKQTIFPELLPLLVHMFHNDTLQLTEQDIRCYYLKKQLEYAGRDNENHSETMLARGTVVYTPTGVGIISESGEKSSRVVVSNHPQVRVVFSENCSAVENRILAPVSFKGVVIPMAIYDESEDETLEFVSAIGRLFRYYDSESRMFI